MSNRYVLILVASTFACVHGQFRAGADQLELGLFEESTSNTSFVFGVLRGGKIVRRLANGDFEAQQLSQEAKEALLHDFVEGWPETEHLKDSFGGVSEEHSHLRLVAGNHIAIVTGSVSEDACHTQEVAACAVTKMLAYRPMNAIPFVPAKFIVMLRRETVGIDVAPCSELPSLFDKKSEPVNGNERQYVFDSGQWSIYRRWHQSCGSAVFLDGSLYRVYDYPEFGSEP